MQHRATVKETKTVDIYRLNGGEKLLIEDYQLKLDAEMNNGGEQPERGAAGVEAAEKKFKATFTPKGSEGPVSVEWDKEKQELKTSRDLTDKEKEMFANIKSEANLSDLRKVCERLTRNQELMSHSEDTKTESFDSQGRRIASRTIKKDGATLQIYLKGDKKTVYLKRGEDISRVTWDTKEGTMKGSPLTKWQATQIWTMLGNRLDDA